jgi:hypothetical protein
MVEFVLDLRVQLSRLVNLFWPKDPLRHLSQGLLPFSSQKIIIKERAVILITLLSFLLTSNTEINRPETLNNTASFFEHLSSYSLFFSFLLFLLSDILHSR